MEVDDFASQLFEESKRFFEKAIDTNDSVGKTAYLHASLSLASSSLEAHINSICEDFLVRDDLTILERSILAEKEYRLDGGEFLLGDGLRIYRVTERVEFLMKRFANRSVDKTKGWWPSMKEALRLRNQLTHPKSAVTITPDSVEKVLRGVIDTVDALFSAIYRKPYPAAKRRLQSLWGCPDLTDSGLGVKNPRSPHENTVKETGSREGELHE